VEKHVTLVGIINIVYHALAAFEALVLMVLAVGFNGLLGALIHSHTLHREEIPAEMVAFLPTLFLVIAAFIMTVAVIGLIGAVGVLKKKEWGRILTLVISFLNLLRVPLGTLAGVYSIWILMNDKTIRLFASRRSGRTR